MRGEPVFLLAFVEHDLQSADPNYQQPHAPIIHAAGTPLDICRIEDERVRHQECDDPDRNIDIEDPPPAVTIRKPTAYYRAEHGSYHDSKRPKRHCFAAVLRWEHLQQDRLRERL